MAVDNPHLRKEWEEWEREMKKSRGIRWRGRMSRWADADARDGGDDEVQKIREDFKRMEEDFNEEEEENEMGVKIDDDELKAEEASLEEERKSDFEERLYEGNKREETGSEEKQEKMVNESKGKKGEEDLGDEAEEEKYIQEVDKEEEHQQQDLYGRRHFREQTNRSQAENLQQSRERDEIRSEEENNRSDSEESNNSEDLDPGSRKEELYGDSEELEDQSWRNDKDRFQWVALDRKEEDKKEMLTKSSATPKEFPNILKSESSDDEEDPVTEDEDSDNIDEVNIYRKDDHPTSIFLTLKEFRDSFVLTDLTLNTEDGRSLHVHSLVLAAVSSLIWKNLKKKEEENRLSGSQSVGVQQWSLCLGPEVDHVGLEAVMEFAYTGLILCVTKHNVERIKDAAHTLGAPRVLDFCASIRKHNENQIFAAKQMKISLESIKQQWTDGVGSDVTLDALGGALHVHRVILAVSSDYFRGMFTLNMKESLQSCVSLPFLLASELEVLVGSSYSGSLPLSWTCIFEVTSAALQLQYQPALSLCLNFLQHEITPHTCLDVVSFAEAYEIPHLLEAAEHFVLRQFQKVSCTSKFKDLPAKQLLKYLSSNSLCVSSELVVFNAAVSWIQANPNRRLKLARELMKMVHFPLMTFKEFKEVQSQNMWCDHSLAGLYEVVLEDFSETAPQTRSRFYLPRECLVLIGGDQISEDLSQRSISGELWFGNSLRNLTGINKNMEWRKLGEMPESVRFSHEVAVLNGQLYVFGGKKYYGAGDTLNSVYRFDPLENSWESLSEMREKRSSFSVVVLDGKIYAIGGLSEPDHKDSVEYYCPTTNTWSFSWSLDLPLSGHIANVFKGQIFVSGGQNSNYLCLSSMFLYHPETGSTFLANMNKPRAHHCMETVGEGLYVAGGITTNDNVTLINQLACEVYSPAANSWTSFASLSVPHVGAGSSVLEGKFYLLGGYSQEDYSDTKMVHCYDIATQEWENCGRMPGPNNDLRACLMSLPQHLRM